MIQLVATLPSGFKSREITVQREGTIQAAVLAAIQGSSLSPNELLVIAEVGGSAQYLTPSVTVREYNLSQKSTVTLFRKEQVSLICCSHDGAERRVLVDFSAKLGDIVLYVAAKMGVPRYDSLNLRPYGTSETLRLDKSLQEQGVTPFNRLFCLTLTKDEQPFFPQHAIDLGFSVSAAAVQHDLAANLLNVSEESLVRATKKGMLNKLNTKKGKYNPRLFVLQDSDLYYFADPKDKKAKNLLHDAMAAAVPFEEKGPATQKGTLKKLTGTLKAEKFDFVVSAGDKTIRLSCKSQEEGMSWIAAINATNSQNSSSVGASRLNSVAGLKNRPSGAVFRNKISAAVKVTDGSEIPEVVLKSIEYLNKQSVLKVVGLFRLSGSAPLIKKLSEDIDAGKPVDFASIADPHTVTGLLKLYFREMEEPLLTWNLYAPLTASCAVTSNCVSDRVRYLKQVVEQLPPLNKAVLARLMALLAKVASYSAFNKMPLHNVATVFAPNILRDKDASLLQIVEASPMVNNTVITLLEFQDYLLGGGPFPVKSEFPTRPYACAHHAYASDTSGDLMLQEQDVVGVLAQGEDGWWYGECRGRYGRFPGSYVALLEEKEAEKTRKKVKIDVKIQEMREQAEYRDKVLAELERAKTALQAELDGLAQEAARLAASDFPGRMRAVAAAMPQLGAAAQQYRDGLGKMLQQTEQMTSQQQEMLIAINALWSSASNPKLQKKYKKVVTKMEPQLAVLRAEVQKNIAQKRQTVDVRSDLVNDAKLFDAVKM